MDTGSTSNVGRSARRRGSVPVGFGRGTLRLVAFVLAAAAAALWWSEAHYSELQARLFSGIA